MKNRRSVATAAAALALALSLGACSGAAKPGSEANPSAQASQAGGSQEQVQKVDCSTLTIDSDNESLPSISPDTPPTVTWNGGAAPANLTVKVLDSHEGGAEIQAGDVVTTSYIGWQWNEDSVSPFDSSFQRGEPATFPLEGVIAGWRCGLVGHHVGDRLEIAIPAQLAYGDNAQQGTPSGPLLFVVEVDDAYNLEALAGASADATPIEPDPAAAAGFEVGGELGKEPTLSIPADVAQPTESQAIVLARGSGPAITDNSNVVLNMVYSTFDGSIVQSTWQTGQPVTISMAQVQDPLKVLIGIPQGSRVLLLLPADQTQTKQAEAYVVDVDHVSP
ncbi:FKBP-type peptidyl-prolyl cis-trans isomerase [Actinomyces vulturis]|uniref:FKBP-type peptidyl-prolyl cis-trans isomerase n=1 Tax=Actinomyces vulturis TaxID=1857645 RepID=UPI00083548E8|nr:FKBP-type peptidyl-prolyl cis-trans isomerase [Actinomyces vulturis]